MGSLCNRCFYGFPGPRLSTINRDSTLPLVEGFVKRVHINNTGGWHKSLTLGLENGDKCWRSLRGGNWVASHSGGLLT
jgi:hypothetical protein